MPIPLVLALLVQAAPADSNPLARALAGEVQCNVPDVEHKTCRSIASYQKRPDGSYDDAAVVAIAPQGPVLLETKTVVMVKGQAVCGTLTKENLAAAKLRVAGQLLPDDQAAPVLAQIQQALAALMDKEICSTFVPEGDHLVAKSSVAGEYQAALDQPVQWVKPSDGYTVAP